MYNISCCNFIFLYLVFLADCNIITISDPLDTNPDKTMIIIIYTREQAAFRDSPIQTRRITRCRRTQMIFPEATKIRT